MKDDAKQRAIARLRQRAFEWHAKAGGKVRAETKRVEASEAEANGQELAMVRELKKLVVRSPVERGSILLASLNTFERQLAKGESPENLPVFVKNLSRKEGLKDGVAAVAQKYGIAGASYYSLWGLNEP